MRGILIGLTILILGIGASGQTVERNYDRFKDETNVSIVLGKKPMDANFNSLSLILGTTFAGQIVPVDTPVTMSILTTSKEWKLLRADLTMRAIVDGERVTIGEFKRNYSEAVHGAVIEGASMRVTLETLRKLIGGQKVEFQFMGSESQATRAELDRIKEFVDAVTVK